MEMKKYPAVDKHHNKVTATIASGVVMMRGASVLLIQTEDFDGWKFPGGSLKSGESLEQCATREAFEEAGIHVVIPANTKPIVFTFDYPKDETAHRFMLFHYPVPDTNETPEPQRNDTTHAKFVPLDRLTNENCAPNILPVLRALGHIQ